MTIHLKRTSYAQWRCCESLQNARPPREGPHTSESAAFFHLLAFPVMEFRFVQLALERDQNFW